MSAVELIDEIERLVEHQCQFFCPYQIRQNSSLIPKKILARGRRLGGFYKRETEDTPTNYFIQDALPCSHLTQSLLTKEDHLCHTNYRFLSDLIFR